jgi:rhomboid protease GluP
MNPYPGSDRPILERPTFYIRVARPLATRGLLVTNVLAFVATIAVGYLAFGTLDGTQDLRVLVIMGAKVNQLIVAGQIWRLFTAMFLHIGVLHLLFNLYALNVLGPLVEGYFGTMRFVAIYTLAGLFGSLASFAFSPAISAGASGAIFGLAGAITVYFLRYRENFGARGRAILQNMLVVIGINLVFGFVMPGIDNWGHLGGLVGGSLVCWGLLPRYITPALPRPGPQALDQESRTGVQAAWVAFCAFLLVAGLQMATGWVAAGL